MHEIIGNKSVLEHVISRVKKANFQNKIIITTSVKKNDKIIVNIAKNINVYTFVEMKRMF